MNKILPFFENQLGVAIKDTNCSSLVKKWEDWASVEPGKIAVIELGDGRKWSWGELDSKSQELAKEWSENGALSGERVAILSEAGGLWIAAIWAAWKLNMVWCPIPPQTAPKRMDFQLQNLDPRVIFKQHSVFQTPAHPPCPIGSAYLIFTSGSTGTPKGVLVGTGGLQTLWSSQNELFQINKDSRTTWMLSPAFDASISDIGTTLTAGATLHIVPHEHWSHARTWVEDVNRYKITHMDAPPSLLAMWARHSKYLFPKGLPVSLQTVIVGGEESPSYSIEFWTQHVRWVNVYGPTETTVCSSFEILKGTLKDSISTLGQPLPGIKYRVCHIGADTPEIECVKGELWIGGDAVAFGYWQMPNLTRQRFILHDQNRWFKTGDLVCKNNAEWMYLGRLDRQLKRNGQLLHLDETEQVLMKISLEPVAVFIDKKDQLVAIFSKQPQKGFEFLQLEAKQSLPKWGIPQKWEVYETWPVTLSGKPDRMALQKLWEEQYEI